MRDTDWFLAMLLVAGVQLLLWMWLAVSGLAPTPTFALSGFLAYVGLACVAVGWYLWMLFRMWREGELRPIARSVSLLRNNFRKLLIILVAVQVVGIFAGSFSAVKSAIPHMNAFWLDPHLADIDHAVFGMDAWRASHAVLGWATPQIDLFYTTWFGVQAVAFYSVLVAPASALKVRSIASLHLTWLLLGLLAATALSSVGPIYYDRAFGADRFADLEAALQAAPKVMQISEMLWTTYTTNAAQLGGGISAMPSLHVASAFWLVLVARAYHRLVPAAWIYFILVWIGSVHLGWHYFTDGLLGVVVVTLIWKFTPALTRQLARVRF